MRHTVPLDEMTVEEKLELMELLWDDLSRNNDTLASPQWHEDVLREREAELRDGKAALIDWEKAKKQMRESMQ